jgi:hypothetical protein
MKASKLSRGKKFVVIHSGLKFLCLDNQLDGLVKCRDVSNNDGIGLLFLIH